MSLSAGARLGHYDALSGVYESGDVWLLSGLK